jgi:phospholipase/carboxylesterase
MRTRRFGSLDVHLAGGSDREGGGDGPLVVLLHGFGAPGFDLVGLSRVIRVDRAVRFAFPEAPIALDFGGRAWWHVDFVESERAWREGRIGDLIEREPPGIDDARAKAKETIDALATELSASKLVLGGFSQGAMLSVDLAIEHPDLSLAGLVAMSGALIARERWSKKAAERAGLRMFQSHGRRDPILPFATGEALRDLAVAAGLAHTWVAFAGQHEIPPPVVDGVGAFVAECFA